MPGLLVVATTAACLAVAVLLMLPARSRRAPAAVRARMAAGGTAVAVGGPAASRSAGAALLPLARRLIPATRLAGLERRITLAGRPDAWPLERVLVAKVVLGAAAAAFGALVFSAGPSTPRLLLAAAAVALGYFTPELLLYSRAEERQKAIQRELPDTLDQMTIAVEAGLGFESAMARAGQNGRGPLAEELRRTLHYLHAGGPRARAFRDLADRTKVKDLRRLVVALLQADAYGVPMAEVLRLQSSEMRIKRRQRAEEQAMKIPIKVLFPLLFCIFPTLFIVLLGPAAINIYTQVIAG